MRPLTPALSPDGGEGARRAGEGDYERFTVPLRLPSLKLSLLCAAFTVLTAGSALAADSLGTGFASPPNEARLRAYWWWLNGRVTKAAITHDLEEMKAKGFGGALICDADGSSQDGNDRAPHGPTFFTPEWRELFKHTLREADRIGLEMSLNLQSGWNMGGPMVKAEQAPKKLVWSETRIAGPAKFEQKLPQPGSRDGFYRDTYVAAYRLTASSAARDVFAGVTASSEMSGHPASAMTDGNPATFWVTSGGKSGEGPTRKQPAWVQFNFVKPVSMDHLTLQPRKDYGPRDCELQISEDGAVFRAVKTFTADGRTPLTVKFDPQRGRIFRLAIFSSLDPRFPESPRNVQITEVALTGKDGSWPDPSQQRRTLDHWQEKAGLRTLHFSAPDTTPLLIDAPAQPGEEDTHSPGVVDLTAKFAADGTLRWEAPAGEWQVLRFGYTVSDRGRVSTCSEGWDGYAIDPLDADAFRFYWNAVVEPLLNDAKPFAGRALKYLHTDSWEIEPYNWTPTLRKEFQRLRGYDLFPFLPVLAGRIVDSRPVSNRFLHDFRKTLGDLAIDNHYRLFLEGAHQHGFQIHPESGGPHAVPIDAQRCLGMGDAPMSEFWAWSWRHRIGDTNRFFVKQPASAAHTYGRKLVLAEGFTSIGPHWQETIWDNLKPAFDKACCEGLNLLVWHAFVCSPAEEGMPGLQYFAGTHFNPNTTWWPKSAPFLSYLDRCQFMLQQGLFVADVCYYYGDHVPNFAQLKGSDPARVLPGYDYDVVTEEAILMRMSVRDGRIMLPDGMNYRALVLRENTALSLPVLRKLKELVAAGATVIGPKPVEATGLQGFPQSDVELRKLANELWGEAKRSSGVMEHGSDGKHVGGSAPTLQRSNTPALRGRMIWGKTAREVLLADGVKPDCEFSGGKPDASLDYIHRRTGEADIYFVANRSNRAENVRCTFRVTDKAPEIWDAVTGRHHFAAAYTQAGGRTTVPLEFAPCGSFFVVFRAAASAHPATAQSNAPKLEPRETLSGPWEVSFDPKWGGPKSVQFDQLVSWPQRPEPGIKFYSGTATYRTMFKSPIVNRPSPIYLDLGDVRELAEVRLNGKSLGIVWSPPFRVDITGAVKTGSNQLEVEVVNFWPNRIIGDDALPPAKRFTRTNIRKLTKDTALMESGLLGPVRLLAEDRTPAK